MRAVRLADPKSITISDQYDSLKTFVSDGPVIGAWEQTWRNYVLGAERFVTGLSLMPCPISIRARPGGPPLAEVAIYNGRELWRRFVPEPHASHFYRTLLLDGFVHRNLVLQVRDAAGNIAVANVARNWKPGTNQVIFCVRAPLLRAPHGRLLTLNLDCRAITQT